ncbi:zinc finger protein [Actinopolyspora sp. H202]|uniref:zinc finger protein n=1 Tax=Actinopolyspora sp. H202 TaxID=1500456 RepID=UPI003EE45E77
MQSDGSKIGLWQPVSSGRHAFDPPARRTEPGELAHAVCGAEISTDELQVTAEDYDWVWQPTCTDCWYTLLDRQQHGPSPYRRPLSEQHEHRHLRPAPPPDPGPER